MASAAVGSKITLADYLRMPETLQPMEILNGEVFEMPTPSPRHQAVIRKLLTRLDDPITSTGIGEVFVSPLDLLIREHPLTIRQPDLFVVSADELARHPDYLDRLPMRVRPLLVVEVLSPSNFPRLMEQRLADYGSLGVEEVWLVSLEAEAVEVLRQAGDTYRLEGRYTGDERIVSPALPHLEITAGQLFT